MTGVGATRQAVKPSGGAAANLPAVDAILESCRALDEDGEPINRESVRARSGVTFTNQLAAGIALYKRRRSLLANHPATPAMIIELITQAVEKQFESVGEKAHQRLQKIQEAFTEALTPPTMKMSTCRLN